MNHRITRCHTDTGRHTRRNIAAHTGLHTRTLTPYTVASVSGVMLGMDDAQASQDNERGIILALSVWVVFAILYTTVDVDNEPYTSLCQYAYMAYFAITVIIILIRH